METVGSLEGSTLLPNMKKWAPKSAVEWVAHRNFAMQIRLPTSSIYGNSGQRSGQLSGMPMGCPWEFCHAN